jgi:uncharacterized protein YndB with AHSA1/START domain
VKTIHHVVDIDSEPDSIWLALTEQPALAAWWSLVVDAPPAAVGAVTRWTFEPGFNPVMETTALEPEADLSWRCLGGHDPWNDNTFRFQLSALDRGRTRLRFWQEYAVELADDDYGTYNFNWGYYLESLRLLCVSGTGKPHAGRRGDRPTEGRGAGG